MLTHLLVCVLMAKSSVAQLNGGFWWLDSRFAKGLRTNAPPPQFEDLSEYDTDESDKIIFRDDDLYLFHSHRYAQNENTNVNGDKRNNITQGNTGTVVWPSDLEGNVSKNILVNITKQNKTQHVSNKNNHNVTRDSMVVLKIPVILDILKDTPQSKRNITSFTSSPDEIFAHNESMNLLHGSMTVSEDPRKQSQHICTYIKKNECYRKNGSVYQHFVKEPTKSPYDLQHICCILPISTSKNVVNSGKIYFPDTPRRKRSTNEEISIALKQRNILLQHRYSAQQRSKPAFTLTKVVTDDSDNPDPYWNIKNKQFEDPTKKIVTDHSKYEYENDYEEYTGEIPRPGLVGLYSDQGKKTPSWSFLGEKKGSYDGIDDYDDENDQPAFGYSTIDPRLGESKIKRHRRPAKLSSTTVRSSSDDLSYNAEGHTISFQSNPDFQVLQGFKLLNIFRNKSRIVPKNIKKSANRNEENNDNKDYVITGSLDTSSEKMIIGSDDNEDQLFEGCGIIDETERDYLNGKQIGLAEKGTHPWLALVVRTKRKQDILCYATLVHPRAALTAADCIYGTSPNEVTVIAGLSDLNDRSGSSHRVVSIKSHPEYEPGRLINDVSLLHWMQPLKLSANIQPACLASPDQQENCFFFGWGGFDQAIRKLPRWQRASVLSHRECIGRLSSNKNEDELPPDAFCASVSSRGTVAGTGAPLMCTSSGRQSSVGVAVWRDNVVIMLPTRDWAMQAAEVLNTD